MGAAFAAAGLAAQSQPAHKRARFKQSAMKVNFGPNASFEDMCRSAARVGLVGFDLITPVEFPILKKNGLICTMVHDERVTFEDGIIHQEAWERTERALRETIDLCAASGYPNTIAVGGQKRGMSQEEGIKNAIAFLNRVKGHAEQKNVTILLEPVNGADRPDQILNRLGLTFDICKRVNSPRVKTLFDIYHAQRIDGDLVRNIRENFQWIGHFHTAGVPGRNEIDGSQEINYRFVAQAIADLDYTGIIAHEWRPSPGRDPVKSLEEAYQIMNV
jgi:hydroxypyruvate isomerase